MIERLKAKQAVVQKRFSEVSGRLDAFVKQRAELDRAIQGCRDEQISLRGEYKALEDMLKDEEPKGESPSVPAPTDTSGTGDGEAN